MQERVHINFMTLWFSRYHVTQYESGRQIATLGKVRLHHYICLKGHLSGSLEKA